MGRANEVVLKENKIGSSEKLLEKDIPTTSNEKQVEEIKMLSEVHDPLINLEKCSLHELIEILQNFASDPTCNVHQAGFCKSTILIFMNFWFYE